MQTAKASRKQSSLSGKESAQGCLPKRLSNACMHAKSLQSRPTLCDPMDSSPPGSSAHGILQARILKWVASSLSNACMHAKSLQSCLTLCDLMDSSPPDSSAHRILYHGDEERTQGEEPCPVMAVVTPGRPWALCVDEQIGRAHV